MKVQHVHLDVKRQAEYLAKENRQSNPDITKVFWFPDELEVRLLELTEQVPAYTDEELYPFYFRASPQDDLKFPSAMVIIRPDEFEKLKLPSGWGSWGDAVEL